MLLTRILKKDFAYRELGGKTITLERRLKPLDIYRLAREGNWACYNFIDRRPDFSVFDTRPIYYGKVEGLGYVVFENELEGK